jgi:hypothetical protein
MRAHPAQNPGQGQILHDDLQGLLVFALLDHLDIALDVEARRTGQAAGCLVGLLDGESAGDGLGVPFVGGLTLI